MKNEIVLSRLRAAINSSGLSYREIGNKLNLTASTIQRYATGQTKKIPVETLHKIAIVCGVTPEYIMGWAESPAQIEETDLESQLKIALFSGDIKVTDEMWNKVKEFAAYVEHEERSRKNIE